MLVGFACMAIAAIFQGHADTKVINFIGLSTFLFWGLGLAVLLKNFSAMMCSALDETAEKMFGEEAFFSEIYAKETAQSLAKKFKNAGFALEGEYLHKRRFSALKDYINYYLITVEEANVEEHFKTFLETCDKSPPDQRRFHKNNVYYMVYFNRTISDEALEMFKICIVNQDIIQDLSNVPYVFLPIVYDTHQGKYIIRPARGRFSINLFQMALREFYKLAVLPAKESQR